jgi:hypothetical protein
VRNVLLSADHFHRFFLNETQDCEKLIERDFQEWQLFQFFRRQDEVTADVIEGKEL